MAWDLRSGISVNHHATPGILVREIAVPGPPTGARVSDPSPPPASATPYIWGYDLVRLLALACVASRHLLAVSTRDSGVISYWLGVPVFAALSGFLAMRDTGGSSRWLARRLERILIPYWIFLAGILAANCAARYKPVTPGLVLAQFLGVAYYTHPGQLIGVHTWFIGAILTCYVIAAIVRRDRRLLPVAIVASLGLMSRGVPAPWDVLLAFLAGAVVARAPRPRVAAGGIAGAALLAYLACHEWFPGIVTGTSALWLLPVVTGTSALWLGSFFVGVRPRILSATSRISYEFFLVHGPIYLGLAKLARLDLVAILVIGTPLSVLAAELLHRASQGVSSASRAVRP